MPMYRANTALNTCQMYLVEFYRDGVDNPVDKHALIPSTHKAFFGGLLHVWPDEAVKMAAKGCYPATLCDVTLRVASLGNPDGDYAIYSVELFIVWQDGTRHLHLELLATVKPV